MALTSAEIQQVLDAIAALGKKIPSLTQAGTLDGTEELEGVKDSATVKMTTAQIAGLINGNGPEGFAPINNLNAGAAPTATDDSSDGYSVGSLWGFGDNIYKCTDATEGAAVWVVYSQGLSGTATITPVVTVGTGSATDFTIYFYRIGNLVHFDFYCRTFTIVIGEGSTTVTVDLTGTGFEPSSDFSGTGDVFGISRPANVVDGANEMSSSSIESDVPKKIKIDVSLTANASGDDFSTSVSGSGSYSI
jgi:hypothetical protein